MPQENKPTSARNRLQKNIVQRRVNPVDHRRPQRWNWSAVIRPLDKSLKRQTDQTLSQPQVRNLRYLWLDGLFAAISDNFYLGYVTLFALAFGANNGQVGMVTAVANLLGAISLFPGAKLVEKIGKRKPVIIWSAGVFMRLALLAMALFPFFFNQPQVAIILIICLNGLRAFMGNLANPGWTALVADLVPDFMRGRYFGSRNMAMGVAALFIAPLAGRLINQGNGQMNWAYLGFQIVFFLAFATGMVSTFLFSRIKEPEAQAVESEALSLEAGKAPAAMHFPPGFMGLIISAFVWNMALQIAAPFFNVYLVTELGATTTMVGIVTAVSSLSALFGQPFFGRLLDRKSTVWVQMVCGFLIPALPLAWIFIKEPWQVGIINAFGGFLWAGYNLSNFNLLLDLTPDDQRPRAVAMYQTAVFSSAVIGPLMGGYIADAIGFQLIFILSSLGRLTGIGLFYGFTVRRL